MVGEMGQKIHKNSYYETRAANKTKVRVNIRIINS